MPKCSMRIPLMLCIFIVFGHYSSIAQVQPSLPSTTKDSIRNLLIKKSRAMTRVEIGVGFSQLTIKGEQWTTDFSTKAKDTIYFYKSRSIFSFSMGCAFPVKKFNTTSALGVNLSMLAAVGKHTSLSIPAFITFRKGGDATNYESHQKKGFSIGIGPQMGLYVFTSIGIITHPFLRPAYMAELSVTPKIGMLKFRLMGNLGTFRKTFPYKGDNMSFNGNYRVSAFTGLIVFTPFWAVQKQIEKTY